MEKNETLLDNDATEVYYYNYYERDRLIYDTTQDNENLFKNIYNFYTGDIINSFVTLYLKGSTVKTIGILPKRLEMRSGIILIFT